MKEICEEFNRPQFSLSCLIVIGIAMKVISWSLS